MSGDEGCDDPRAQGARNAAVWEEALNDYVAGRVRQALDVFDENAVIVSHFPKTLDFPFAGEWRGRVGAEAWVRCMVDAFETERFDIKQVDGYADRVTAMHDVRIRHRETGAVAEGVLVQVARMKRSKVVEFHEHFDAVPMQAAILTARILSKRRRRR